MLTWADTRDGDGNADIYAQRLDAAGNLIGGDIAIAITNASTAPIIAYNNTSNEFLITWLELSGRIFGQRLDAAGNLIGGNFTVFASGFAHTYAMSYNSIADQYLVTWCDSRGGLDIYAQRVNSAGSLVGGETTIFSQGNSQCFPSVASSSITNQYMISWDDQRNDGGDIYAQRIDSTGNIPGPSFAVSTAASTQGLPAMAFNNTSNEFLITWRDFRNGSNLDIYAQRMDPNGNPIGADFQISGAADSQNIPTIAYNSTNNEYLIAWQDFRNGNNFDIYAQRVGAIGNLIGGDFAISTAAANQERPRIAYNSTANQYTITWSDTRSGNSDIYAQQVAGQ